MLYRDACGVDDVVESAELVGYLVDDLVDAVFVGDVNRVYLDPAWFPPSFVSAFVEFAFDLCLYCC